MKKIKTKGIKLDNNKVPLNLISNYAMEELAKVLDFGQKKIFSLELVPWYCI